MRSFVLQERKFVARCALVLSATCFVLTPVWGQTINSNYEAYVEVDGKSAPDWLAAIGRVTGSIKVGTVKDVVSVKGDRYYIESEANGAAFLSKMFDNLRVSRRSDGSWVASGQATTRFFEKRGSGEPATAVMDYRKEMVGFSRGGALVKSEPLKFLTSDTVALPYVFLGRSLPTKPVTLAYTDGRSIKTATFDGTVVFPFQVAGQSVPTVRYVARRPTRNDPDIELWVRAEDGFPVRIKVGLSAKYGVRADAVAANLPPVFKKK